MRPSALMSQNYLKLVKNGRHVADDIFKCIFFKEKCFILLVTLRYNLMTPKLSKFTNKWFEQWPMSDISLWSDDSEYFAISFKITAMCRYK